MRFDRKEHSIIKHKDLLSNIKMGKEILTFDDIENEKNFKTEFCTATRLPFFKKI